MRKSIYYLMFAIAASLTLSACTEEEVAPSTIELNGGGGGIDPK